MILGVFHTHTHIGTFRRFGGSVVLKRKDLENSKRRKQCRKLVGKTPKFQNVGITSETIFRRFGTTLLLLPAITQSEFRSLTFSPDLPGFYDHSRQPQIFGGLQVWPESALVLFR